MLFSFTSAFLNLAFSSDITFPTLSFRSPLFHLSYHHHHRRLLPPSSSHANPSSHFSVPDLVFICKKLTTSIMAYYPIAPLCCCCCCCFCCLVSCFQAPFLPRSPQTANPPPYAVSTDPTLSSMTTFMIQIHVLFATYSYRLHY